MADELDPWIPVKRALRGQPDVPMFVAHDARAELARVTVDERGISLAGEFTLARDEVTTVAIHLGKRPIVVVGTRGRACAFSLRTFEQAQAFVARLGRSPERVIVRITTGQVLGSGAGFEMTPLRATTVVAPLVLVAGLWLAGLEQAASAAAALAAIAVRASTLFETVVDFGEDGLGFRGVFDRTAIFYREIEGVEPDTPSGGALVLTMKNGTRRVLRTGPGALLGVVVERVRSGMARCSGAPPDAEVESLVAAVRVPDDESDPGYRSNRVPREQLWRVLEDGAAPVAARARAGVALSSGLAPAERQRFVEVADTTVSSVLRSVLDRAASSDARRFAQALAELERDDLLDHRARRG